jgi:plasmanylethanolamine desaturase
MADVSSKVKLQDADTLAKGYSKSVRALEIFAITVFFLVMTAFALRIAPHASENWWIVLAAILCGFIAADFLSGFVHWLGDTWGSTRTPVLGQALIRPFREHHVDQKAITRHDFVETNGNNCLISLPVGFMLLMPLGPGPWHWLRLFMMTFAASTVIWVMATNQFHKWAHADKPPALVVWLQKMHLVLPPAHHAMHHASPFNKYYCITVGWLNWPLYKLRFFPILERVVTATFGWVPREDDIGEEAALEIAPIVPAKDDPEAVPADE